MRCFVLFSIVFALTGCPGFDTGPGPTGMGGDDGDGDGDGIDGFPIENPMALTYNIDTVPQSSAYIVSPLLADVFEARDVTLEDRVVGLRSGGGVLGGEFQNDFGQYLGHTSGVMIYNHFLFPDRSYRIVFWHSQSSTSCTTLIKNDEFGMISIEGGDTMVLDPVFSNTETSSTCATDVVRTSRSNLRQRKYQIYWGRYQENTLGPPRENNGPLFQGPRAEFDTWHLSDTVLIMAQE